MKELFDKLSSYNLFTNLLPGLLFCFVTPYISKYSLVQKDFLIGVFIYYFVGLVIGRIGSLIIEPIIRKLKIAVFVDYKSYIKASKLDPKIELFSEINNGYRNYIALVFALAFWWAFSFLSIKVVFLDNYKYIFLGFVLLLIFLLSYRKQTSYISKRVDAYLKE